MYGLAYGYDLDGRRLWLKHPRQLAPQVGGVPKDSAAYAYHGTTGLLTTVRDVLGNSFQYVYDNESRLDSLSYPGNVGAKMASYDADGNLTRRLETDRSTAPTAVRFATTALREELLYPDARAKLDSVWNRAGYKDSTQLVYTGLGQLVVSLHHIQSAVANATNSTSERGSWTWDALGNMHQQHTIKVSVTNGSSSTFLDETDNSNYYPGTDRLRGRDFDHYDYDLAGNLTHGTHVNGLSQSDDDAHHYYGADGLLRVLDSRSISSAPPSPGNPPPAKSSYEEYRYDALGRRIYVRSRNVCLTPEQLWMGPDLACVAVVRRTVWDGSQKLYEIQAQGDDSVSATGLERDTTSLAPDSRFFGRVAYTHGTALDEPLGLVRLNYVQPYNGSPLTYGPLTIVPHWNYQGVADWGHYEDGAALRCTNSSDLNTCVHLQFIQGLSAFQRQYARQTAWFGTVIDGKRDGSGQSYRRHRYDDPSTGRFTQEDPIGLAGGLSAYGFAAGDPV